MLWQKTDIQSPKFEARYTSNNRHSLAGNPCLPEITWLRAVVFYHGVVGRLAHTMVKVSQNDVGVAVA